MDRSEVWEEVLLLPMRIKFQLEGKLTVAQLPGYQLQEATFYGKDKIDAIELLEAHMCRVMGRPNAEIVRPDAAGGQSERMEG